MECEKIKRSKRNKERREERQIMHTFISTSGFELLSSPTPFLGVHGNIGCLLYGDRNTLMGIKKNE
jgi:hypothetical protein